MRDYAMLAGGTTTSYQQTYHVDGRLYGLFLGEKLLWYEQGKAEISGVIESPDVYLYKVQYTAETCGERCLNSESCTSSVPFLALRGIFDHLASERYTS